MPESRFVLDTSAWLTLIEDEDGAETVEGLIRQAEIGTAIVMSSFMSYMEVFYISFQERGQAEAETRLEMMEALPVLRVESNRILATAAGRLKAKYRLSLADSWIAALAQESSSTLVHKDPEFDDVPDMEKVLRLPFKS